MGIRKKTRKKSASKADTGSRSRLKRDSDGHFLNPGLRIPVFVSAPSQHNLNEKQKQQVDYIQELLEVNKLAWHGLGRNDYAQDLPLREVLRMIQHCSGGLILGFRQIEPSAGFIKKGAGQNQEQSIESVIKKVGPIYYPSPWNQLEAGILFNQRLPILAFREPGVTGGVFDVGTAEIFLQDMPEPKEQNDAVVDRIEMVFQRWASRVKQHYYGDGI